MMSHTSDSGNNKTACCVLVLGFLHYVRVEFNDDVSETTVGPIFTSHSYIESTAVSGTSSGNSPRTPCKTTKSKNNIIFTVKV